MHVDDYLMKLVKVDSSRQLNWLKCLHGSEHLRGMFNYQCMIIDSWDVCSYLFLQTVKAGEAAVRGTMEPVSKSKSMRVCVMVLTLLVEEPVPIWRS